MRIIDCGPSSPSAGSAGSGGGSRMGQRWTVDGTSLSGFRTVSTGVLSILRRGFAQSTFAEQVVWQRRSARGRGAPISPFATRWFVSITPSGSESPSLCDGTGLDRTGKRGLTSRCN